MRFAFGTGCAFSLSVFFWGLFAEVAAGQTTPGQASPMYQIQALGFDTPLGLNSAGEVAGTNTIYNSSGIAIGQESLLYNGNTTLQIGLTGEN